MDIIIIVVIVIAYVGGRLIGRAGDAATVTVGTNSSGECDALCAQWQARRGERCAAEAAERTARARADSLRTQYYATLAIAAVLLAEAISLALIPFGGWILAAPVFQAAAAATALAILLLGMLHQAEDDVQRKAQAAGVARTAESDADRLLTQQCPADLVARCRAAAPSCQ